MAWDWRGVGGDRIKAVAAVPWHGVPEGRVSGSGGATGSRELQKKRWQLQQRGTIMPN